MIGSICRGALLAVVVGVLALPALAGEADPEPDDSHEHGAPFFGEVKDIRGMAPLESAMVKFQVRGTMRFLISQTDTEGQFRRAGLGLDIDAETIDVTCEKSGYRTVEVVRRRLSKEKLAPVEIECLMEKAK